MKTATIGQNSYLDVECGVLPEHPPALQLNVVPYIISPYPDSKDPSLQLTTFIKPWSLQINNRT